ncbi:hypothetical protein [Paratractidigestivibacter sp.]|nr:hypothetical protein [Paratractidigestivibacter sp.]
MASAVRIRAFFKQATLKGGTATLQFEILTVEDTQQSIELDDGEVWDD